MSYSKMTAAYLFYLGMSVHICLVRAQACKEGYSLLITKCEDIDECKTKFGACAQKCTNTPGSYTCTCDREGYTVDPNGPHNCKAATDEPPRFLFSAVSSVRTWAWRDGKPQSIVVDGTTRAVAVDYSWDDKLVFWSDVALDQICSVRYDKLEGSTGVPRRNWKIIAGVNTPDGLAVDWVHKLLYWTDKHTTSIEVSKFDGSMRTKLIKEGLRAPRAIAVDPIDRYIYWSDWGHGQIERSGQDGSDRKAVVKSLQWPNGITIGEYTVAQKYEILTQMSI